MGARWAPSDRQISDAADVVNAALSTAWHVVDAMADPDTADLAWAEAEHKVWESVRSELRLSGCPEDRLDETCAAIAAAAEKMREVAATAETPINDNDPAGHG